MLNLELFFMAIIHLIGEHSLGALSRRRRLLRRLSIRIFQTLLKRPILTEGPAWLTRLCKNMKSSILPQIKLLFIPGCIVNFIIRVEHFFGLFRFSSSPVVMLVTFGWKQKIVRDFAIHVVLLNNVTVIL